MCSMQSSADTMSKDLSGKGIFSALPKTSCENPLSLENESASSLISNPVTHPNFLKNKILPPAPQPTSKTFRSVGENLRLRANAASNTRRRPMFHQWIYSLSCNLLY